MNIQQQFEPGAPPRATQPNHHHNNWDFTSSLGWGGFWESGSKNAGAAPGQPIPTRGDNIPHHPWLEKHRKILIFHNATATSKCSCSLMHVSHVRCKMQHPGSLLMDSFLLTRNLLVTRFSMSISSLNPHYLSPAVLQEITSETKCQLQPEPVWCSKDREAITVNKKSECFKASF